MALLFRGPKFSQITVLKEFIEINIVDACCPCV